MGRLCRLLRLRRGCGRRRGDRAPATRRLTARDDRAPGLLESLADQLPDPGRAAPVGDPLLGDVTPREREVLIAVARGLSTAEIAEELVLSEATVKTHVGRVLAKLTLRDRVQTVVYAYERGLISSAA